MAYVSSIPRPGQWGDRYLLLLSVVLFGYAMNGKGFAYLGVPPIFVGEIALISGAIVYLRTGCLIATLASLPSFLLAVAMLWVLVRTLPFVGAYGFDALRDSVVVMYGAFAFIIIALLLEKPSRINTIIRYYGVFLTVYLPAVPFLFAISRYMQTSIPRWPAVNIYMLLLQPGEVATHLVGAMVFTLVGLRKMRFVGVVSVVATLPMISVQSRGAILAAAVPVIFATVVSGHARKLAAIGAVGLAVFFAAYILETSLTRDYREPRSTGERSLSTRQIAENAVSIVGPGDRQTEGTKEWRFQWWTMIVNDTVFGPNFWTGRGFGLNLADADGFRDGTNRDHAPLREPHNVIMTMLARAGVPGEVLWLAVVASWMWMLMRAMWIARRRGDREWAGLFLFITCYVMSIIINAAFDVALSGPVQGIWFWCLMGFGIGSVMVYRCRPRDALR
jgi:hypothetical protein